MYDCIDLECFSNSCFTDDIKLSVQPSVAGVTVVSWTVSPSLLVPSDALYQLQFSRHGHNYDDSWQAISDKLVNTFIGIDDARRDLGQLRHSFYRVVISVPDPQDPSTNLNTWISKPVNALGANYGLKPAQLRMRQEIIRREIRRYRDPSTPAQKGYLIRLKRHGPIQEGSIDPDTGQIINDTEQGYGTKYGYYDAYPCFYMDMGNYETDIKTVTDIGISVDGPFTKVKFLNIPQVDSHDIWVDAESDERWWIGKVTTLTKVGSEPLVCSAVAGRISFDDAIYKIPVGDSQISFGVKFDWFGYTLRWG
jgi:hypothetical protein